MKHMLIIFSFLCLAMSQKKLGIEEAKPPLNNYSRLELLEYKQFEVPVKKFDLSGLVRYGNAVLAINDKDDPVIYEVFWKEGKIILNRKFETKDKLDLEAIDSCGDDIFLSNEKKQRIYKLTKENQLFDISPDYKKERIFFSPFDANVFFEGLAVDCKNQILYMFKEREERYILNYDLKLNKITDKWNIPESDSWDFSDAKFENGFLYVIERGATVVTKINPLTKEVIKKYSYQNLERSPDYLFGPALNTLGEGLLLTAEEIWIAFDNNGRPATHLSEKDLKLKGKNPLIARFRRPKDF